MCRPVLKSVAAFTMIAYVLSWSVWIGLARADRILHINMFDVSISLHLSAFVRVPGNIGPAVAAIIVAFSSGGKAEVWHILRGLIPRRTDGRWILFAAVLPLLAVMTAVWWTDPNLSVVRNFTLLPHWLVVFILNLPFAPLCEEIGWRGYLLPQLQSRLSPILASLAVGIIWGPWHLPLYARDGVAFLILFFLYTLGISVVFSWFFNISRQSLFVVVFLHASFNATALAILAPALATFGIAPFVRAVVIIWVFDAALLLVTHGGLSIQQEKTQARTWEQEAS